MICLNQSLQDYNFKTVQLRLNFFIYTRWLLNMLTLFCFFNNAVNKNMIFEYLKTHRDHIIFKLYRHLYYLIKKCHVEEKVDNFKKKKINLSELKFKWVSFWVTYLCVLSPNWSMMGLKDMRAMVIWTF